MGGQDGSAGGISKLQVRSPSLMLCHAPVHIHTICIIPGLRQRALDRLQTHSPLSRCRPPLWPPPPSSHPQPAEPAAALPADAYVVASPCSATAAAAAPGSRATAVFTVGASLNPEQFKEVALQVDFPKALWPSARLSCQTATAKGEWLCLPASGLPMRIPRMHARLRTLQQRNPSLRTPSLIDSPTDLTCCSFVPALSSQITHPPAHHHSHHM
jgi:hypothetical protein